MIATAALAVAGPVWAEERVAVGGETLFVLKSETVLGKSAKVRAGDCYDRLRDTLGDTRLRASDIRAKPLENYGIKIVARGRLIIPIGAEEAKAHGMSMKALGDRWVRVLRKKLPMLRARPDLTLTTIRNHPIRKRRGR